MLIYYRYQEFEGFEFAKAEGHGVVVKERHTIIEEWPWRLKKRPGEPGAQEEFDIFIAAGPHGTERYMEWRKVQ